MGIGTRRKLKHTGAMDDLCESDGLFHVTSFANMEGIARDGLVPRSGAGLFSHGGYGEHSRGKVFLACGKDAALAWYGKVQDQLWHHFQDEDDPDSMVPVVLMVLLGDSERLFVDEVGNRDVPGSFYVTNTIPPGDLMFWSPSDNDWVPVDEWGSEDPMLAVSSVEYYDDDGDPVEEDDLWTARSFEIVGPYEDGGFKPNQEDESSWEPA